MKGKEEASKRILNYIEISQLSDTEFKTMITRKLNALSANYQKLQGNYEKLTAKYISIKKGHRNYQQRPRGHEEYNF